MPEESQSPLAEIVALLPYGKVAAKIGRVVMKGLITPPTEVEGFVKDSSGHVIYDVVVHIGNQQNKTTINGRFLIQNPDCGHQYISLEYKGQIIHEVDQLNIKQGVRTTLTLIAPDALISGDSQAINKVNEALQADEAALLGAGVETIADVDSAGYEERSDNDIKYISILEDVLEDTVITAEERIKLRRKAGQLGLSLERAKILEQQTMESMGLSSSPSGKDDAQMSNDSETSEGTISEFQDLLKTEMSDWDKYFSFKDDGYLFWGTNFHESFIYLYLEIDEDDSEDVDIYIGLLNLHPRKNKFSKLKESYYTIDDPEYFADNWEWDCSESEIFYSTTIELGEFVNNLGWIREGLLQWQSFLSLNGLRLAKPE